MDFDLYSLDILLSIFLNLQIQSSPAAPDEPHVRDTMQTEQTADSIMRGSPDIAGLQRTTVVDKSLILEINSRQGVYDNLFHPSAR